MLNRPKPDAACGLVAAGSTQGTGYLVSGDLVVTSAHVVQRLSLEEDGTKVTKQSREPLTVRFRSKAIDATIERLDTDADVAVLRLERSPSGIEPLTFGTPDAQRKLRPCRVGTPRSAAAVFPAVLINPSAKNRFGENRMTLRSVPLAGRLIDVGQPYAGAPVLVHDRVIGHVVSGVRNPGNLEEPFAGLVEAAGLEAILALLPDLPPRGPDLPGRNGFAQGPPTIPELQAPKIDKKDYHAFISYRGIEGVKGRNDQDWTNAIMDRLSGMGFRCYAAPHTVYGESDFDARYGKALRRSRVALLAFTGHWTDPPFADEIAPILKRLESDAKRDKDFRVVLLKLDDTDPGSLSRLVTIDLSGRSKKAAYDWKRMIPSWEAVLDVARVLALVPTPSETPEREAAGTEAPTGTASLNQEGRPDESPAEAMVPGELESSVGLAADEINEQLLGAEDAPELLRSIAIRWIDAGMPGSDVPVEAARLLIAKESFEYALEVLERADEATSSDSSRSRRDATRILRMKGVALGEAGRHDEAIKVLEKVRGDLPLDVWAGGILGSNYKQKWVKLGSRRRALLRKSYDVYFEAFSRSLGYYPGINAATLARLLGREDEAVDIARRIRSQLDQPGVDYLWELASLGEANLILARGKAPEKARKFHQKALEFYERAAVQTLENPTWAVSIRQQFPLILAGDTHEDIPEIRARLDSLFHIGGVAAFAGYRVASPDHDLHAFPERRERWVRRAVQAAVAKHDVSWGVCSLSDGCDVLFAEAVLAREGRLEIILPYSKEIVRERRVTEGWRSRFDRILSDEQRVRVVELRDEEPTTDQLPTVMLECVDQILDRAIGLAGRRGERPSFIGVHDPDDHKWIPAFALAAANDEGLLTEVIDPDPDGFGRSVEPSQGTTDPAGDPDGPHPVTEDPDSETQPVILSRVKLGANAPVADSTARPQDTGDYARRHLIAIGIDRYHKWPRLQNAKRDAKGIVEDLTTHYDFEVAAELYDDEATEDNIERVINQDLADKVEEDDLVVIFFAGHGDQESVGTVDKGYLVPVEAPEAGRTQLISMATVHEWAQLLKCSHLLLIFDSCFSGSAATRGSTGGPKGHARKVITAGRADQKVADGGTEFPEHSVFTGRLRQALTGDPAETLIRTPIQARDLTSYLVYHVPADVEKLGHSRQVPQEGLLPGHGGGTILFKRSDQ